MGDSVFGQRLSKHSIDCDSRTGPHSCGERRLPGHQRLEYLRVQGRNYVVGRKKAVFGFDTPFLDAGYFLVEIDCHSRSRRQLAELLDNLVDATYWNPNAIGCHYRGHRGVECQGFRRSYPGIQGVDGDDVFEVLR